MNTHPLCLLGCVLVAFPALPHSVRAQEPKVDEPNRETQAENQLSIAADWQPLSTETAVDRLQQIMSAFDVASEKQTEAVDRFKEQWSSTPDLLTLELAVLQQVHPPLQEMFLKWKQSTESIDAAAEQKLPKPLVADVRVAIGRDLARERLFDEALKWLAPVEVEQTLDPATLLFFRAVCRHAIWDAPDKAKEDLQRLLRREQQLPVRYKMTARLMLADLTPKGNPNPLDEVSRLMSDVGRRLDLGRAGDTEVKREVEIIEKLDKLIEDLEQQRQKQQQQRMQAASKENSKNSQMQPMQDSQAAGGSGAGDVDRKDLGEKRDWGDLPPAAREQALQKLGQQLPSHYRDVIEGYFRKIAIESTPTP